MSGISTNHGTQGQTFSLKRGPFDWNLPKGTSCERLPDDVDPKKLISSARGDGYVQVVLEDERIGRKGELYLLTRQFDFEHFPTPSKGDVVAGKLDSVDGFLGKVVAYDSEPLRRLGRELGGVLGAVGIGTAMVSPLLGVTLDLINVVGAAATLQMPPYAAAPPGVLELLGVGVGALIAGTAIALASTHLGVTDRPKQSVLAERETSGASS